jgi:ATP-dependent protease ClpP protease subunit
MSELTLYGEIGAPDGVNVGEVVKALQASRGSGPVTLRINSIGGDLLSGLALYNQIKGFPDTIAIIDGAAASIASVVMLGAGRVLMPENAWVMVHPPSAKMDGEGKAHRELAELLDRSQAQLVDIYVQETGQSCEVVQSWMASGERWFDASEALAAGLIDEIIPAVPIRNSINLSRFAHVPDAARKQLTQAQPTEPMKVLLSGLVKAGLVDCGCMSAVTPDETAISNEVAASVEALTTENASLKDKIAALEAQLAEITAKQKDSVKDRAITAIDAVVAEGRLAPSLKVHMINAYVADEAGTLKSLAELPRIPKGTEPIPRGTSGNQAKSIKDQIDAETDPKKKIALYNANWTSLIGVASA